MFHCVQWVKMRNSIAVKVKYTTLVQKMRPIFLPISKGSALLLVRSVYYSILIVVIIIIFFFFFLHGLGRLTCSGIDALPSLLGDSTISSSSRLVVVGVFREYSVIHLSRWLIQFCLCLMRTFCIPEISSSFLMISLLILSSLVYALVSFQNIRYRTF
jgi:hypothetical protein